MLEFLIIALALFVAYKILRHCLREARARRKYKAARAQREEKERKEKEAEKQRKESGRQAHWELTAKYAKSSLLKEIVDEVCVSRDQLPEEFAIYDDRVQATTNGKIQTYSFSVHRVPFLEQVFYTGNSGDFSDYFVRPQVALAEAINNMFGNQYALTDRADIHREVVHHTYGDDSYYCTYQSNYVLMRLKATKSF